MRPMLVSARELYGNDRLSTAHSIRTLKQTVAVVRMKDCLDSRIAEHKSDIQ